MLNESSGVSTEEYMGNASRFLPLFWSSRKADSASSLMGKPMIHAVAS